MSSTRRSWVILLTLSAPLGPACGPSELEAGDADTGGTGSGTGIASVDTTTSAPAADSSGVAEGGGSGADEGSGDDGPPPGPAGPVECGEGIIYQCGDAEDNDGDGLVDGSDPECTGPCDDDEGSFQTGIPGDNVDCFQDCFFDGNSGHEDDMCWWNITCDPANPGEGGLCAYNDSPMCMMEPPYDNSACVEHCLGNTPNGCDCYGCCTVETDGGEVHVWLGSGPDCALDNLEACATCTPNPDCSNDCDPTDCELCFGEETLPEGCDTPGCPEGVTPCTSSDDCAAKQYCLTGCCIDYVPPG